MRIKIETMVAQQMGLVDEENAGAAAEQIAARQQAMAPQLPGVNGAGGAGGAAPMGGPMGGPTGAGPADLNTPLTPDTYTPERIDLAR